jgi:hypothetical protein
LTALRPFSKFSFVKKIFMFEVLSSTELAIWSDVFVPNYFEDIEKYIEWKKEIFSLYETEIRDFPHPRSLEGIDTLTKFRWMQCGKKFAEGFLLYKSIN